MSDRCNVRIWISGTLSAAKMTEFFEGLIAEDVHIDWEIAGEAKLVDYLREQADQKLPLVFDHYEKAGGQFEYIKGICREFGLTYYECNEGYTGCWPAGGEFWKPGLDEPRYWLCDSEDGEPGLRISELTVGELPVGEIALMNEAWNAKPPFVIDGVWLGPGGADDEDEEA